MPRPTVIDDPLVGSESHPPRNDIPFSAKATLVDEGGVRYRAFRGTLTPRWHLVWLHMGAGYAVLAGLVFALAAFAGRSAAGIAFALLAGISIGYVMEFLSNFFHEAAHWNVAPGRARNDLLANLLLAWQAGLSIEAYRPIHFQHHRSLGTTMDSENSYFDALRVAYLAAGLFGLKTVRTLRRYRQIERAQRAKRSGDPGQPVAVRLFWMGAAGGVRLGVAALLWVVAGSPVAAVAWLWGVVFVFPFFGSLRQLLEHRAEEADADADYRAVDHGPTNRLFGDGPLASTLGSAGFNRHALHHWEPTISYTRLRDVQRFLESTALEPAIRERQTTYLDTFLRLLEL